MISITAPAKLNLTLEVTGRRSDGYHEIRSIVQTIDLADTLIFEESNVITWHADKPDWQAGMSLVSRAADVLQAVTGHRRGATVSIKKRIPLLSGLGGDSSDAAAVLVGLNALWDLGLPPANLLDLACGLGSDVPLFLYGGTLLLAGRGESITPLPPYPEMRAVLLIPRGSRQPGKTSTLYAALTPAHYTRGEMTEALAGIITRDEVAEVCLNEWGIGAERYTEHLFNVFESVAFAKFPGMEDARVDLQRAGAPAAHLSGTGPALFALFFDDTEASEVYSRLKADGRQVFLTGFRRRPPVPEE